MSFPSSDPYGPYGPPQPQPTPAPQPGRQSRALSALRHPGRTAALLAILIGYASIFSAVLAWQASLASIDSSRHQSLVVQEAARRNQLERLSEGTVAQDERFVAAFQEQALAARELQAQAATLRESDPDQADILDLQAQGHLALARALQPFFMGAGGITLGADGAVGYDRGFVLRNLRESDAELRDLRTQRSIELAERADTRTLSLIGVAAVIVAALFFLTVAQVSRSRARVYSVFFALGGVLVVTGTLGYLVALVLS